MFEVKEPDAELIKQPGMSEREREQLERAYRIAYRITRKCYQFSRDVPTINHDLEEIPARQVQSELKGLDAEIQFLENVLAGKVEPSVQVVEGQTHTVTYDKARVEEDQVDREALEQGINVLKSWRRIYAIRLAFIKLQQPKLKLSEKKVQNIVQEAAKTVAEIDAFLKEKSQFLHGLESQYNKLVSEYEKLSTNPDSRLPSFPTVPSHINHALKKRYQPT